VAPAVDGGADAALPRGRRLVALVAKLSMVNVIAIGAGLVTGPLQARALGAEGRGMLAAILVPTTLLPWILSFGLPTYASRAAARGVSLSALLGTVGPLLLVLGLIGAVAGIPLAVYIAEDRHVVLMMLLFAFCTVPIALLQQLAFSFALGLARFRAVSVSRLLPPLTGLAAVPVLYIADALTVTSASIVAFTGGLLAAIPLVPVVRQSGRPRFERPVAREALDFGAKTWIGGLSGLANARLDQLLMIKLVSERELGLYAVAVTLAGFSAIVTSALSGALLPRVARGDFQLAVRSIRVTLMLVAAASVACAGVAPFALPLLFGHDFRDATVIVWILLIAGIPLAANSVLGAALASVGHAGAPSFGQGLALIVTLGGLPLALPKLGGEGAALVSLAAYSLTLLYLVHFAHRKEGGRFRDYVVPTPKDLRWLGAVAAANRRSVRRDGRNTGRHERA
jgi:O-antigen/teichoic acid export membrane protein